MKTKYFRPMALVFIGAALGVSSQATASAADNSWLQSLFGTQSSNSDAQTPTNSGNIAQDQSLVQGYAEALNRTEQKLTQDNQTLQQAYSKLQQDRQAGADTRADMQTIQAQKQALRSDQSTHTQQLQNLRTYQTAVAVDQGQPAPVFNDAVGYPQSNGRKWDRAPQNYQNAGSGQQDARYNNNAAWQHNQEYHRQGKWNGYHRRTDLNNDSR